MNIFNTKKEIKSYLTAEKQKNKTIGFVPTMGALHKGHLSLIKEAKKKNDLVVVSIFVNPTQFNNTVDFVKYPKTIENDTKLLNNVLCDVLFLPSAEEIYTQNIVSDKFDFDGLEHQMEGKHRKGHFDGVATVVKTFFEIIDPDIAYFGQKDFQQLQIIKKMVRKNRLNVKIKGCPIFRENDGLAMSSRNIRLNKTQRKEAPFIYKTISLAKEKFKTHSISEVVEWVKNEFEKNSTFVLEYFEIANIKTLKSAKRKTKKTTYRAFIAVFAGEIRQAFNLSHGDWGLIYSGGTLASAIAMLFFGGYIDKYKITLNIKVVIISLSLLCLTMTFVNLIWCLPIIIFGLRFFGQGMLIHIPAVAIGKWYGKNKGKALSLSIMGFSIGEAIFPVIFVFLFYRNRFR